MSKPRCPRCGKQSHAPSAANPHAWYCHGCRLEFEDVDDGDVAYGRPSKRLEREEARQLREKARQGHAPVRSGRRR